MRRLEGPVAELGGQGGQPPGHGGVLPVEGGDRGRVVQGDDVGLEQLFHGPLAVPRRQDIAFLVADHGRQGLEGLAVMLAEEAGGLRRPDGIDPQGPQSPGREAEGGLEGLALHVMGAGPQQRLAS